MSIHLWVQPRTIRKLLMHLAIGYTLTKMAFAYFMVLNIITMKETDQCSKKLSAWNVLQECLPFLGFPSKIMPFIVCIYAICLMRETSTNQNNSLQQS